MGPSLSSISSILLVPSIISPVAKYFEKLNFISAECNLQMQQNAD